MYELCNDHGQPLFEATRDGRLPNHQIHTVLAYTPYLLVEGAGKGVDKDKDKGVDVRESKLATVADPMARNLLWQVILYILLTHILLTHILLTHIMLNDITY